MNKIPNDPAEASLLAHKYYQMGLDKMDAGQYADAIQHYNDAIRIDPDAAPFYHQRGVAKYALGQFEDSLADFNMVISLYLDEITAVFLGRGHVHEALDQVVEAIEDYDSVIRLQPNHAEAYYCRGELRLLLHQFSEAKQDLQTALELVENTDNDELKSAIQKALHVLSIFTDQRHRRSH